MPNLTKIILLRDKIKDWNNHPFSVPVIRNLEEIMFTSQVTFFVGENGSGKSTLLEAIADHVGFGKEGGSRNIFYQTTQENSGRLLSDKIRFSWHKKLTKGYFLRAESFFNVATYLDSLYEEDKSSLLSYGNKSLHHQSHGESFLSLFNNRFSAGGIYLLDEPEAALSPQRQLSFLIIIHDLIKAHQDTQFIIATHSPILLGFPNAQILSFNDGHINQVHYEETETYQVMKGFLNRTDVYLKQLGIIDE